MNLLSDIRLKWYDDESLLLENPRDLASLFLDCLGVSRKTAVDVFEVLLIAKSKGVGLTSEEIKSDIIALRKKRKEPVEDSLTLRNIQIWLKFFRELELIEKLGFRYMFSGNKKPSDAFIEKTKPEVIDRSAAYIHRLLKAVEKGYEIK